MRALAEAALPTSPLPPGGAVEIRHAPKVSPDFTTLPPPAHLPPGSPSDCGAASGRNGIPCWVQRLARGRRRLEGGLCGAARRPGPRPPPRGASGQALLRVLARALGRLAGLVAPPALDGLHRRLPLPHVHQQLPVRMRARVRGLGQGVQPLPDVGARHLLEQIASCQAAGGDAPEAVRVQQLPHVGQQRLDLHRALVPLLQRPRGRGDELAHGALQLLPLLLELLLRHPLEGEELAHRAQAGEDLPPQLHDLEHAAPPLLALWLAASASALPA
eukprot:CAMPEP_0171290870 /NCGR_PEP_ID=MMETSP0790-20130122/71366_1 /TAXON_ID=2925 /ORGANISM="Alexandrium catenella, Strain OF101" /LENGTH=273 /DNA_ID=CAMNT_0011760589 /DNA_START=162 /DNA_END=980 /DNA_ORIENTATION=-